MDRLLLTQPNAIKGVIKAYIEEEEIEQKVYIVLRK